MTKYFDFNINDYLKNCDECAKTYEKLFKSLNIHYMDFSKAIIIQHYEKFEKLGRSSYPQKATFEKWEVLNAEHYLNTMTGILFFHDRKQFNYTAFGNIPYKLTCQNPTKDIRVARTYKYISVRDILKIAGEREKAILNSLIDIKCRIDGNNLLILTFQSNNKSFDYCVTDKRITN